MSVVFKSQNWTLEAMITDLATNICSCKKVKVKVTLIQALRLCSGRTAQRGRRGIALPFHDHGTRRG
jgi:hypothetical protein